MKRIILAGLLGATLALPLIGCSDHPSSPTTADRELNGLIRRTQDLQAAVTAAGRMTPELRATLGLLSNDVQAWQARTGREDISVSISKPSRAATGGGLAVATQDGDNGCAPCPSIRMMGNSICFLYEVGECKPDEFIQMRCGYICFKLGTITQGAALPKAQGTTLTR